MGRFVIHGTLIEEPRKSVVGNGLDCITIKVEEKVKTPKGEELKQYTIDFFARYGNCIPTNLKLSGAPVVVFGTINSKSYNGREYYDLRGEQLSIITSKSFAEEEKYTPTQADVNDVKDKTYDNDDVPNDDLPF